MSWKNQLRSDSLPWLLESENPGVRYLALRDLLDLSPDDKKLKTARKLAHKEGPIAHILSKMDEEGFWKRPGTGYGPKYKSTVWALILLAQLGASVNEDKRIRQACRYYLDHSLSSGGQISAMTNNSPSGTVDCLQGNMLWSLMELGYHDPRMDKAFEWMARTVTGDGIAPMEEKDAPVRYYAYKCGPTFGCGVNNKLPCAWGGVSSAPGGRLPRSPTGRPANGRRGRSRTSTSTRPRRARLAIVAVPCRSPRPAPGRPAGSSVASSSARAAY